MISYSLVCDRGHEFEGWFGSSKDFDDQNGRGLVSCPACGSAKVSKALMAPNVSTSRKKEEQGEASATQPSTGFVQAPVLNEEQRAMLGKLREIKQKIVENAENVGEKFPEEARKIHYGESEARGIYGKANLEEAAELAEEGIDFLPLPDLPEDKN